MSDLLDLLADLDPQPSPTVDVQRGYRPPYEKCPDCGSGSFSFVWSSRTHTYKVVGCGWLTVSSCPCGRYLWRNLYCGWLPESEQPVVELPLGVVQTYGG